LPQVLISEDSLVYVARRAGELRGIAEFFNTRNGWELVNFAHRFSSAEGGVDTIFLKTSLVAFFSRTQAKEVFIPKSSVAAPLATDMFKLKWVGARGGILNESAVATELA